MRKDNGANGNVQIEMNKNEKKRKRKWKYRVIGSCKRRKIERTDKRQKREVLNAGHWPKYKMIQSVQGSSTQRFSQNVFIGNSPFCSCDEFQSILRRLYSLKNLRAKDAAYHHRAFNLPFCSHIFAVKLACILKEVCVVDVSEEEWAERSIKHVSHQMFR